MDDDERDREQSRAAVSEDDIGHVVSACTDRYRDPLTEILGRPVPDAEVAMWALLDEQQRKRALRRAHALIRWNEVAEA